LFWGNGIFIQDQKIDNNLGKGTGSANADQRNIDRSGIGRLPIVFQKTLVKWLSETTAMYISDSS